MQGPLEVGRENERWLVCQRVLQTNPRGGWFFSHTGQAFVRHGCPRDGTICAAGCNSSGNHDVALTFILHLLPFVNNVIWGRLSGTRPLAGTTYFSVKLGRTFIVRMLLHCAPCNVSVAIALCCCSVQVNKFPRSITLICHHFSGSIERKGT